MRRRASALLLLLAVLVLAACENAPASPSAIPDLSTPSAEPAAPTAAELEAIRFRTENSLQADLEHVRAVAADPSAGMEFGVPLLPSEFDELMSRSANAEDIIAIVQAEAAKAPNDYCGMYLDNASEGAVTSLWKANRLVHELAIRTKVRPGAPIAFGDCRFSELEQDAAMDAIRSLDDAWLREIPAAVRGYGFDTIKNVLEMDISSAVPNAALLVRQAYEQKLGFPPGMLVVTSDGTGAALRPRGTLLVFVLRPNGQPVGANALGLTWASTDLPGLQCGVGDMGYGVPTDGSPAELPCQQGTWEIEVWERGVEDVIGGGTVQVQGGKTAKLTIRLTREPNPNVE
jgi:hypothetical protein